MIINTIREDDVLHLVYPEDDNTLCGKPRIKIYPATEIEDVPIEKVSDLVGEGWQAKKVCKECLECLT